MKTLRKWLAMPFTILFFTLLFLMCVAGNLSDKISGTNFCDDVIEGDDNE